MTKQEKLKKLEQEVAELKEEIKNEPVIHDIPAQRLQWGKTSSEEMNWEEAIAWCKKQGKGWRLPTIFELMQAHEDKVFGFISAYYWSATEYSTTYAWLQSFANGEQYSTSKYDGYYVRCVFGR